MKSHDVVIRPTRTRIDLRNPTEAEYWDGGVIVVQQNDGGPVAVSSTGDFYGIGDRMTFRHDDDGRHYSDGFVIGRIGEGLLNADGVVPQKSVPHWVFK